MKHPLASHLSLRSLATVVATLLGQAFADGLDRAPILPKTHAAPAPLPFPTELDGLLREDAAILAAFLTSGPIAAPGAPPTASAVTAIGRVPPPPTSLPNVHSHRRGVAPSPAAPTLRRSP